MKSSIQKIGPALTCTVFASKSWKSRPLDLSCVTQVMHNHHDLQSSIYLSIYLYDPCRSRRMIICTDTFVPRGPAYLHGDVDARLLVFRSPIGLEGDAGGSCLGNDRHQLLPGHETLFLEYVLKGRGKGGRGAGGTRYYAWP